MNLVVPITAEERPSRRVKTVAEMLDADESQVRRLVDTGELEAHVIGKRGIRIYLDSVADYQARQTRTARARPADEAQGAPRRVRPAAASTAAHRAAKARLRAEGIL
jgi:excisionase family DNA binding protein